MLRQLLATLTLCAAAGPLLAAEPAPGVAKTELDPAVRAQDDFFRHVNGRWLSTHEVPADKAAVGGFTDADERARARVREIVEATLKEKHPTVSEAQKIADLYAGFLDEARLETLGVKPLAAEFARVDALRDKKEIPALMAHLIRIGVTAPFDVQVHQDAKDATQYVVDLAQSGLGLPDRDYYLKDDDKRLVEIRGKYVAHIEKMLTLAGEPGAAASARNILALETALAQPQWTKVEIRDPVKAYNKVTFAQLTGLAPNFAWPQWMAAFGIEGKVDTLVLSQPSYIAGFSKVLEATPLDTWKAYFRWHILSAHARFLSKPFELENFAFRSTTLFGVPQQEPRWKRGLRLVEGSMGEAVGKLYVAKYFPPAQKARADRLVANMLAAYRQSIDGLDWMGPETRKQALLKLSTFNPKIGYPKQWRDYSALQIVPGDLVGNVIRAGEFDAARQVAKLGKPVDRDEWFILPETINAYYNAELNEIVFPAGILQPPFFDADADDAVNYGAIGSIIGHEISHGFDDQGSQYDEKGNLRNWWTPQDHERFKQRTTMLVNQYDAFVPVPGYHVNGELTLGENIADNSGLSIAMKAYKLSLGGKEAPVIDGLTGEQRFYLGFAQAWRAKLREQLLVVLVKTDPHSPNEFRVNGTLRNQDEFYRAFGLKEGDKLYLPPQQRVRIW